MKKKTSEITTEALFSINRSETNGAHVDETDNI